MSEEEKKPTIHFDISETEHVFTDVLQVVMSGDTIVLDIAIRDRDKDNSATVSHSIHLTVPHFLRVNEVFGDLADKINEQIESQEK